jgi:hypothetical protein
MASGQLYTLHQIGLNNTLKENIYRDLINCWIQMDLSTSKMFVLIQQKIQNAVLDFERDMVQVAQSHNYGWMMLLSSTGLYHQKGVRAHCNCQEAVIAGHGRACANCDDFAEHTDVVYEIA